MDSRTWARILTDYGRVGENRVLIPKGNQALLLCGDFVLHRLRPTNQAELAYQLRLGSE